MDFRIIKSSSGTSKETFLFFPSKEDLKEMHSIDEGLDCGDADVLIVNDYPESGSAVESFVDKLADAVSEKGIRWLYAVGVKEGSTLAQAMAIRHSKLIRRLMLIDPQSRKEGTTMASFIDKLESYIPCGLPLRKLGDDFDSRSDIHRVHTPSLIILTEEATSFEKAESDFLFNRLPNAWLGVLSNTAIRGASLKSKIELLLKQAIDFKEVAVKSPQKNK